MKQDYIDMKDVQIKNAEESGLLRSITVQRDELEKRIQVRNHLSVVLNVRNSKRIKKTLEENGLPEKMH